jgi:hypothetical protein
MRSVTVRVTEDHFRAGVRRCCVGCPVYLALRAALPSGARVNSVNGVGVTVNGRPYLFPEGVAARVHRWDCDGTGEPFEFVLEVEDAVFAPEVAA